MQTFQYQEIERTAITNAPYNPRSISDYTRKRLRKQLETNGLVETPVWNARTGHLVGGHQRLSIVDDIEGRQDYRIGVAVIDVDLKREMELNVALNNPHLQGAYEADKFFELLKHEAAPDVAAMGFTTADLEMEFGALPEVHEAFEEAQANIEGAAADIAKLKERRKAGKEALINDPENDSDYYLMVIFQNAAERERFLQKIDRPLDMRYMQSDELVGLLEEKHRWK